ncbi:MAG: Autophagy protein 22 [Phylliscum demangeonii]|nr:MAG: Autophagy protein 22 [Phylliscum demangeonii]
MVSESCVIYLFGAEINTASFAMYTFSLSVLLQALVIISMSGAADHGRYRKSLLLLCAFIGSVSVMMFLVVAPKVYLMGSLLAIIANVCYGLSSVLLNSFLPLLVRYHPSVQQPEEGSSSSMIIPSSLETEFDEATGEPLLDSTAALLPQTAAGKALPPTNRPFGATSRELRLSTQISSYGIGIGYMAAVILQTLSILIVLLTGSSTFSLRLVLFVIGLWWFAFTIPAALWLRPRPGPPLLTGAGKTMTWTGYIIYAWKGLGRTVVRARQLKDIILFLSAWFLLSDGIATVSGTAVLFAKTQLKMSPAALASINVIVTVCGVIGAFSWRQVSSLMGLRPSQTILACILIFELIPLYGLLGYIPAIRRLGMFGLQQPWEMYPVGAIYGFVLGGLSSYCRSLFGELIPPGSEAAFYALYAITDKGSSIFGPAVVGLITDRTGSIRPAFVFLAFLVGLPAPLMWCVDVERGKRDAAALVSGFSERDDERHVERHGENEVPNEVERGGFTINDDDDEVR